MAKKDKAASAETGNEKAFGVNVGEWHHAESFSVLGVPSGYVVYHGSTACFVPAVEENPDAP